MLSDELWERIDKVPGWLTRDEADFLHGATIPPWCEIGSWMGRSALVMADKGPGWAVDWFKGSSEHPSGIDTLPSFLAHTAGAANITVIPKRFQDAIADVGEINTLHLDAEHSYDATREALRLYAPKLNRDGIVLLHDALPNDVHSQPAWPGVHVLALELAGRGEWQLVGAQRSYMAFRKR